MCHVSSAIYQDIPRFYIRNFHEAGRDIAKWQKECRIFEFVKFVKLSSSLSYKVIKFVKFIKGVLILNFKSQLPNPIACCLLPIACILIPDSNSNCLLPNS
jgi:hypothetical protein